MTLIWQEVGEAYCEAWTGNGGCYTVMSASLGHYRARYRPPPSRRRNKLGVPLLWQAVGYARSMAKAKAQCEQHFANRSSQLRSQLETAGEGERRES